MAVLVISFVLGFLLVAEGPLSPFGVMLICVGLFFGGVWCIFALPFYLEPVFRVIDRTPNRIIIPICFAAPVLVFGLLALLVHG